MKKWWNDIRRFGRYLSGRLKQEAFCTHASSEEQAEYEQTTQEAIRWYGRRKVRREIKNVHRRLITDKPDSPLGQRIRKLFPKGNL